MKSVMKRLLADRGFMILALGSIGLSYALARQPQGR